MTVNIKAPGLTGQTFEARLIVGGVQQPVVTITDYGVEPIFQDITLTADGGRVFVTNEPLTNLSAGRAVARTDGGTTLFLDEQTTAQTITADIVGGGKATINVLPMESRDGWAPSDYYMLETDPATGDVIVEPGRIDLTLYITASTAAYDEAKIAAEWNAANGTTLTAASITGAWLVAHPEYGATTGKALTPAVAKKHYEAIPRTQKVYPSPRLLFERGYDYGDFQIGWLHGESPLHPRVVGKWGTGADPDGILFGSSNGLYPSNHVFQGVSVHLGARNPVNCLYADVTYDGFMKGDFFAHSGERSSGITVYRSMVSKVTNPAPSGAANEYASVTWHDSDDRCSGIFIGGSKGLLFEKATFWHNGWGEGFGQNREGNLGQPPSNRSHNWYISAANYDVTIRNSMSMQGASTSWQFRSGGWLMNNISIDDDIHGSGGGAWATDDNTDRGQYTFPYRIVSTSAGYKKYNRQFAGGINWGMDYFGPKIPMIDSYICHMADPDNAAEVALKTSKAFDYNATLVAGGAPFFNAVSYKWSTADRNTSGLNATLLNTTTIQRFAAAKRGSATSIYQFGEWLVTRTPAQRAQVTSDAIEYFLTAIEPKLLGGVDDPFAPRAAPLHHVFDASPWGEGYRADNPVNWNTMQLPGRNDLDSVDLNGNTVKFLIDTIKLAKVWFKGGTLKQSSGVSRVAKHADAAKVIVHNCGQYYAPAGTGDYEVRNGGRLVFTGAATVGIAASGQSELCLGRNVTIPAGKALRVTGDMGWAGWDWTDGTASLAVQGDLEFEFTPVLIFGGFQVDPFILDMTKPRGQTSGFTGDFDSVRYVDRDNYHVRIRDASGTPIVGEDIVRNDYLPKLTETWRKAKGIAPAEIGKLQRFRSGRFGTTAPGATVTINLSGAVKIVGQQYAAAGTYDLGGGAGTGVTYVNNGATLPAGATLTGGKLVLTVS